MTEDKRLVIQTTTDYDGQPRNIEDRIVYNSKAYLVTEVRNQLTWTITGYFNSRLHDWTTIAIRRKA